METEARPSNTAAVAAVQGEIAADGAVQGEALQTWKADFFKALAHPARIRILEQLRDGEKSAGELMQALHLEQSNASQHLAVLRSKNILVGRRVGTNILYSARDPVLYDVLDLLRRYFFDHLVEMQGLLDSVRSSADRERQHPATASPPTEAAL